MTSQRRNVKRSTGPAPNLLYAIETPNSPTHTLALLGQHTRTYTVTRIPDLDPVISTVVYPVSVLFHSESEMTTIRQRRVTHGTTRGLSRDILGGWTSLRFENFSSLPLPIRETCISFVT